MREVYFDCAATTRRKPERVLEAMVDFYKNIGASPGRGGYSLALDASRIVLNTRLSLGKLFNVQEIENIVLTHNITYALNMIIKGALKKGDHVVTTSMEHNAVIRPLNRLRDSGLITLDYVQATREGTVNPKEIEKAIKPETKLVITTHCSNVTGTILPIKEIANIVKKSKALYVVDAAQTAGSYPIDLSELAIDVLAFTGHKGLYGPTGTGGFIITKEASQVIDPLIEGGTGSISNKDFQPDFMPDKFESGTTNTIGIAGLGAGVDFILEKGIKNIYSEKKALTKYFLDQLKSIEQVKIHGPAKVETQTSTISISIKNTDLGQLSFDLDDQFGIMTRSGLHCAPYAHQTIGTFPQGTLRFSFDTMNSMEEIDYTINALKKLI